MSRKVAAAKEPVPLTPAPVSPAQMRYALQRMTEWVAAVGLANVKRCLAICAEEAGTVSTSQELVEALHARATAIDKPVVTPAAEVTPAAVVIEEPPPVVEPVAGADEASAPSE
jgi:hypothetical protein